MNVDLRLQQVVNGHFAANRLEPQSWVAKAQGLLEAAQSLEDTLVVPAFLKGRSDPIWRPTGDAQFLNLNGICLMLRAYALENLCKAVLMRTLPEGERQAVIDGTLAKSAVGHDLPQLFTRAGLEADEMELGQLQRPSKASVWFGRYPVPLRSKEMFYAEVASHLALDELEVIDADRVVTKRLLERALAKAGGA